jgi:hypothetical protein
MFEYVNLFNAFVAGCSLAASLLSFYMKKWLWFILSLIITIVNVLCALNII